MVRKIKDDDQYLERLVKLIPSEILALYFSLAGIFTGELIPLLVIFIFCTIATPIYLIYAVNVRPDDRFSIFQIIASSISFIIWSAVSGGVFLLIPNYDPRYASAVMLAWTFLVGIFLKRKETPPELT